MRAISFSLKTIGWVCGSLLILLGLSNLAAKLFLAISMILWGVLCLPVLYQVLRRYDKPTRRLIAIGLFVAGLMFGMIEPSINPSPNPSPQALRSAPASVATPTPPSLSVAESPRPQPSPSPLKAVPSPAPALTPAAEPSASSGPTSEQAPVLTGNERVREPLSGQCDCPYDTDKRGRACGARSAYAKPGGRAPICYASDTQ